MVIFGLSLKRKSSKEISSERKTEVNSDFSLDSIKKRYAFFYLWPYELICDSVVTSGPPQKILFCGLTS